MDPKSLLLTTALRRRISEPNVEAGFQCFNAVAGQEMDYKAFCEAVAECVRKRLIHEPVRLPEGALQCHWHLELTPKGVEAARSAMTAGERNDQGGG